MRTRLQSKAAHNHQSHRDPRQLEAHALVSLLVYSPWNVRVGREVVSRLRALGGHAVPALVSTLHKRSCDPVLRLVVAKLLATVADNVASGGRVDRSKHRLRTEIHRELLLAHATADPELHVWLSAWLETANAEEHAA